MVLPRVEFPANVYPWLGLDPGGAAQVRGGARADNAGRHREGDRPQDPGGGHKFVEFMSGFRNDLGRLGKLCRSRGVYLVVDGIQGVGALRINVRKCMVTPSPVEGISGCWPHRGRAFLLLSRVI